MTAWSALGAVGLARLAAQEPDFFTRTAPDFAEQARRGQAMTAADYAAQVESLLDFRVRVAQAFDAVDIIMTPSTAAQPWPLTELYPASHRRADWRVRAAMPSLPAGSMPRACPAIALPAAAEHAMACRSAFQLVGRPGRRTICCSRLPQAYEAAHPWADRWPPAFA